MNQLFKLFREYQECLNPWWSNKDKECCNRNLCNAYLEISIYYKNTIDDDNINFQINKANNSNNIEDWMKASRMIIDYCEED